MLVSQSPRENELLILKGLNNLFSIMVRMQLHVRKIVKSNKSVQTVTKFVQTFWLIQSHTTQTVGPNEAVQCIFRILRVEMKIVATTFADQNF